MWTRNVWVNKRSDIRHRGRAADASWAGLLVTLRLFDFDLTRKQFAELYDRTLRSFPNDDFLQAHGRVLDELDESIVVVVLHSGWSN
ncbi:hypothetical protein Slin15195_G025230 [Septoria linicola]|uniref:Uncharacterized protein n=1 Tax=Septoria linicola TaxID=215465 RepID=A0A9Q9AGX8_9PEZI|nr:hypothetical protein Slin15195_G025230 [Septoria linicola]